MSRFSAFQYPGEFSFLATANQSALTLTGRMRAHWNFRGIIFPAHEGALDDNGFRRHAVFETLGSQ